MALPVDRLLNLVYFWLTKDGTREQVAEFDRDLWLPPVSAPMDAPIPAESPWSKESEEAAMAAFAKDFSALG
jgi:hypothetical protein